MARTKISTLNLRIHPDVKHAVKTAAAREHRSVANMVEVLILRHCSQTGISLADPQTVLTAGTESGAKNG